MDDAEAEAVLLVLGTLLDWEEEPNGHSSRAFLEDGSFYFVGRWATGWKVLLVRIEDGEEQELLSSLSRTATKAACERHHATGKWK